MKSGRLTEEQIIGVLKQDLALLNALVYRKTTNRSCSGLRRRREAKREPDGSSW